MKIVLTAILMLCYSSAFCQSYANVGDASSNPFLNDANGRPLYLKTNYTAEGSPYYADQYMTAQILTISGVAYNNVKVKINLEERIIQYLTTDGKEMIADLPVKRITFTGIGSEEGGMPVFLECISTAINTKGSAIYEVLDTGKIKLLKKITVSSRDEKRYNDAGITRVFERKETFFSLKANGEPAKLQKSKAALLELFSDKSDIVAAYIDQHNLSCKTEKDFKAIFRFYNFTGLQRSL